MELLKRDWQRPVCRTKRKNVCVCVCICVVFWKGPPVSLERFETMQTCMYSNLKKSWDKDFSNRVLHLAVLPQFPLGMTNHTLKWEGVWRELGCLARSASFAVREESGHSLKSALSVQTGDFLTFCFMSFCLLWKLSFQGMHYLGVLLIFSNPFWLIADTIFKM